VTGGLGEVARTVLAAAQDAGPANTWSERDVIERALATLADARQSWTRSDLTRSISDALPGHLALPSEEMRSLLEALTDAALEYAVRLTPQSETANLPTELHLADGRSAYSGPGTDRWATPGQVAAEHALRAAAVERGAPALTTHQADALVGRFAESGHELAADQTAALRGILTSGARIEVLAAAAGAGKTFTIAALAEAWTATGGRVVGLAPTQVAADVMSGEGLPAMNTTRWLAAARRGDPTASLADGDLVLLDEAGMTSTAQLVAVHQKCAQGGAKLLLVGDPRQLTAVGPGGALADLATRAARHELTDVRRFREPWERAASLQLRDGDPSAVEAYHRHGRLVDAGTREQAEAAAARAWLADTLGGRESLLLVGSNEAGAQVSAQLRAELVALGRVDEVGVSLGLQGTVAGVGDLVQARRNGWELLGW
jgi:AAA domain